MSFDLHRDPLSSAFWGLGTTGSAATLTQLRCALFFEARRDRHSGGYSLDEDVIRRLLQRIRLKVEAAELD